MTTTVHLPEFNTATGRRDLVEVSACEVCTAYRQRRASTIAMWVTIYADRRRVQPIPLLFRYLASVHARHLAGGCLSTRRNTPTRRRDGVNVLTVHRVCGGPEGCGADLGDANEAELDAAQAGDPLPDVRLECGCFGRQERVA